MNSEMNYEARYWELREECERALDRAIGNPTTANQVHYVEVLTVYQDFCMDVLEMLMDANSDVLKRLKG